MYRVTLFLVGISFFTLNHAHSGGVDSNGGHIDKKTGIYHCHAKPCVDPKSPTNSILSNTEYDRENWNHWIDIDSDCQDTRAETLILSSKKPVTFKSDKKCVVDTGLWFDPYTGAMVTDASTLDIDHIVPLKEAYLSGAKDWSEEKKELFANDSTNLIAVSASENREKGSKDITDWLPDTKAFHCQYVMRWVAVKANYELDIDPREQAAIDSLLLDC